MYRIIFTEEAQKDLQMLLRSGFTNFNPLARLERGFRYL
jgi:plasmid stabilization system protein ParE